MSLSELSRYQDTQITTDSPSGSTKFSFHHTLSSHFPVHVYFQIPTDFNKITRHKLQVHLTYFQGKKHDFDSGTDTDDT